MEAGRLLIIATSALLLSLPFAGVPSNGQPMKSRIVRIAELEIDPAQLDSYKAALREDIETSIRVEPGVLTLYAVSVKGNPTLIRILEVYADADA